MVAMDDDFDFDQLEVHQSKTQNKNVKAFATQRLKVKPQRRHQATRNPVKILRLRDNVTDLLNGDDDEEDEEREENGEELEDNYEEEEGNSNGGEKGDFFNGSETSLPKRVGRHGGMNTGKVHRREVELARDAKKGLESKEDIGGASRSLRVTEKCKKTGIGTEKTNPYDGVKDVMFFHIKGARHIQTRLVEPTTHSMNSGDVFVLVTPKYVHQWNGKNCSIMEKARGSEVSAVVQQWKELGCIANTVNLMDEDREKPGAMTKAFWKILGDKSNIKKIDDVLEDKAFEKSILASNKFYEIKSDEGQGDDAKCWLEVIEEYSGKVPSKKWLVSDKAYVLDFGTEVYSWIGRNTQGGPRKRAAEMGLEYYNKGFKTDADVHPYNLNATNTLRGNQPRPEWSVYGRMAEKTENVAFRRKFYDWPDPVDLKVKTVEAKVHAQLTKEYKNEPTTIDLLTAIPGKTLAQPTEEPLMVLDGSFIGRGKGMRDEETLFRYGVTLNELKVWRVATSSFDELSKECYGIFYSAEAYIVKWNFQIYRTGIRHLKGGKSHQDDVGKDRTFFFFWQGADCSASDKGAAALMTVEMDTEEGPQLPVHQGKEPPSFYQLFDGKMIVHSGKRIDDEAFSKIRLYVVRNEVDVETCLVEVTLSSASLRSRGSFVLSDVPGSTLYIWHGAKSTETTRAGAVEAAKNFRNKISELHSSRLKSVELQEGEEEDGFWNALGDDTDYMSYIEVSKTFDFTPRCFAFDSLHGHFQYTEITSSCYHPDHVCPFPMQQQDLHDLSQPALVFIDVKYKLFLWQGWWPASDDKMIDASGPNTRAEKHRFDVNRKLAMESIKSYAEEKGRSLSRAFVVYAGCEPLEFKNLFPTWIANEEITSRQIEAGHKDGEKKKLMVVLEQLVKDEYTLAELTTTPLPEGVDPARIEQYLNKDEFLKLFGVSKTDFSKVPRWKQIELKKKTCLF